MGEPAPADSRSPASAAARFAAMLDRVGAVTGRVTAWLTLLMVLVTVVIVIMRYVFDTGLTWLQESLTWMHAAVFMLAAAYTLGQEEHVRVDVFYRDMSAKRRALVDSAGVLLFLWPLCAFLAFEAWDYVRASWLIREVSRDSGGLPYPAIPLLKSIILVMPAALALQGLALLLRSVSRLAGR